MPNSKSAAKRYRQSLVRRDRNRARKSKIKTQVRKVREAIAAGDVEKAEVEFRATAKTVDQAAAGGVVHTNLAGRLKSRLSAAIKAAKAKK
ncbi:MAG: 30S ribosomal protein S20 [Pirellulales bacterium]